jgi:hypothetical protein
MFDGRLSPQPRRKPCLLEGCAMSSATRLGSTLFLSALAAGFLAACTAASPVAVPPGDAAFSYTVRTDTTGPADSIYGVRR